MIQINLVYIGFLQSGDILCHLRKLVSHYGHLSDDLFYN